MASTMVKPQDDRPLPGIPADKTDRTDPRPIHIILKPSILVVIPCYNEEVSIGSMVLRSLIYADHVLVVDDGSSDKTAEIARLAGAEVIQHEVNKGKGEGIKTAFVYARNIKADILVLIDGDGQHNPDEIPLLVEPILKHEADMVNGSRFLVKNCHNVPWYRRIGQDVLTLVTNTGSGQKFTDSQNGFRAFSRSTFDCFSFGEHGMGIESEMLMDAVQADLRIREAQIDVRYDVAGSTYNPVVHGFSVLGSVLKVIASRRPVLVYGLPGLILLLAGILALSYIVQQAKDITGNLAIGYATLSMFCIITGVLCIFTLLTIKSVQRYIQKQ